jgi:hypothetical protein
MRASQLQRFKAHTGVAVFPVPAAAGTRGRWVRGMIVAEASDHWVEAFVAEVAQRRTSEEAAAGARHHSASARNAEEVVTASLQVRALKPPVHTPCYRPLIRPAASADAMGLLLESFAAIFSTSLDGTPS